METIPPSPFSSPLARQLLVHAETGRPDNPYRLARMVARVLVSERLKQRRKWCSLAKTLAEDPAVEQRLIHQALGWLRHRHPSPHSS